ACGLFVVAGVRPRVAALAGYVVAVCAYRWGFLVMFVDDAIVHWLLLWVVLLPVGHTLRWRRGWETNAGVRVSGFALRMVLANLVLLYVVAGTTKWGSPMWRNGDALYAVLMMPGGYWADRLTHADVVWLRPFSWLALVV